MCSSPFCGLAKRAFRGCGAGKPGNGACKYTVYCDNFGQNDSFEKKNDKIIQKVFCEYHNFEGFLLCN